MIIKEHSINHNNSIIDIKGIKVVYKHLIIFIRNFQLIRIYGLINKMIVHKNLKYKDKFQ